MTGNQGLWLDLHPGQMSWIMSMSEVNKRGVQNKNVLGGFFSKINEHNTDPNKRITKR